MRRLLLRLSIMILTFALGLSTQEMWVSYNPPYIKGQDKPVPYTILTDKRDARLVIGVEADLTERQLYATLSQAADEHQFDGRDYLFTEYLWVEAYLVRDGRQSSYLAGRLRRYIPIINPEYKDTWEPHTLILGRQDRFSLSLQRARQSL